MKKNNPIGYERLSFDFKDVFAKLYEDFSEKGLPLNELDYNLVVKLLEFVKSDYNEVVLLFNEMLELYKNKNISVIEHALFKDFSFISKKSKRLYDEYENFFNIFDEKKVQKFLNKLDYYMSFMFYIINNLKSINLQFAF